MNRPRSPMNIPRPLLEATFVCIGAILMVVTILLWAAPSSCMNPWDALVDPQSCEAAP